MNWDTVKGEWKQFRGKVKEQWGKLTDDDLDRIEGKRDQLLGAVQKRYGLPVTKPRGNSASLKRPSTRRTPNGDASTFSPRTPRPHLRFASALRA